MNKNDSIYYIGIVILFIAGFIGDTFIRVIIIILNAIFGVMESNYMIKEGGKYEFCSTYWNDFKRIYGI